MRIEIIRYWGNENQTLGVCTVYKNDKPIFSGLSLERGWRNNLPNISCIPMGDYRCVLEYSNRFKKDLWEIKDVPNRSETKFHAANYWHQLEGCIALGQKLKHLNNDKEIDITSSRNTMKAFHTALNGETEVQLTIKFKNEND